MAGAQGKRVQEELACPGWVELGQVQADELWVKYQGDTLWVGTAMSVFLRLLIWDRVTAHRDKHLARRLMDKVVQAAADIFQPALVAVDGFFAYPDTIRHALRFKQRAGKRDRTKHPPWPYVTIGQVVKRRTIGRIKTTECRFAQEAWQEMYALTACTRIFEGRINTAYTERLNVTFRAHVPSLFRRAYNLAASTVRLEAELFWTAVVYNFCTVHIFLDATLTVAANLTDYVWSANQLLRIGGPRTALQAIL